MDFQLPPPLVTRFAADLDPLVAPPTRLGVAVSGGPDSLALLLLAAAAYPGQVEAATVDHGLRPESAAEAQFVAGVCGELNVPHEALTADWAVAPVSNIPAIARSMRYNLLSTWRAQMQLSWIATAHHLDDQAETLM